MAVDKHYLRNNPDFYLDDRNIERLYSKRIDSVQIVKKKLNSIYREKGRRIIPLNETMVYQSLVDDQNGSNIYDDYCRNDCGGSSLRSKEIFLNLKNKIDNEGYDIRKGAIVVDQLGIVLEGQHRCCILLQKYGDNYTVDVLQFNMKGLKIKQRIKIAMMKFRNH